mmetsp:Transcript_83043/g.216788  ORF Transcript_83043/g.216788 Transcript_83043/m.216788 type:complete len:335 (-) Transcript_83043:120-1124(-)
MHMIWCSLFMPLFLIVEALELHRAVDTLTPLPEQWKQVAVVFAGHHYKIGGPPWPPKGGPTYDAEDHLWHGIRGTTDWRVVKENREKYLFSPLERNENITVHVYFHTWPSHKHIEEELVEYYKNRTIKYKIASKGSYASKGVDSRAEALKLIEHPETYDAIILTRFELRMVRPLDSFIFQHDKVNVPFREISEAHFRAECRTSDLLIAFPPQYMDWYNTGKNDDIWHSPIPTNPLADPKKKDEYGCPQWRDKINLMCLSYGWSGEPTNPLGHLTHELTTLEKGPYYSTSESYAGHNHNVEGVSHAPTPKAKDDLGEDEFDEWLPGGSDAPHPQA